MIPTLDYTLVNAVTFGLGVLFLYNSYRLVRRGREDITLFTVSAVLGIGLIVVATFPGLFQALATVLGLEFKARAILVVSNLTLFAVVMYLFNQVVQLRSNVSKLNEELSLLRKAFEDRND